MPKAEDQQEGLRALAAAQWRVAVTLTAAMIALYFGFILLIAFKKEFLARLVRFRGGKTIPQITLNVEPIGSQRLPSVNLLTFRVEKGIRMGGTKKLAVRLDLHNALNANTVIQNFPRSGPDYLTPLAILGPRLAEVSATFTF